MTPRQRRSSAVDRSTIAFLCGLCGVEELPGPFLIEVFGALGMSISGARSYLARAVADGRLASHRRGRQTLYSLNGTLLRRYRTVRRGFDGRPSWNGHFHIAIYNIPEARRPERDALRAAAFDEGWASPRPGVLLGIQPPGIWADRTDCSTGRLDVDLSTARELAASAWPLDEAAQQIRHLASHLEDIKARYRDLDTSDTSRPALLTRVVATHEILSNTTYLWGMLPNLPMELFPEDYPHDVLARVAATHEMLSNVTYVWGTLPALPAEILPADYPHEVLTRITAEMSGPLMTSGARAAKRLLADHRGPGAQSR